MARIAPFEAHTSASLVSAPRRVIWAFEAERARKVVLRSEREMPAFWMRAVKLCVGGKDGAESAREVWAEKVARGVGGRWKVRE